MAKLVAGMASSHAFALMDPSVWDENRQRNRQFYQRFYGQLPPEQAQITQETDADLCLRYDRIRNAHDRLANGLLETGAQALVLIGDDQNEHFTEANVPQMAIYVGGEFVATDRSGATEPVRFRSESGLATAILEEAVNSDVDMSVLKAFPEEKLIAHAHGPMLQRLDPQAQIPVVLVFVNAIHHPAPRPARCYYLGQVIRRAVERYQGVQRVAVCGSGGLSHFSAGYPWKDYTGSFGYGAISQEFDRRILGLMEKGQGQALADLTSKDLLDHGEIELRSWITVLGAVGNLSPELLVYEPSYRGIMGMGVGYWPLPN